MAVGKTHFLGSLFKLNAAGRGGFSVQPRNIKALGPVEQVYRNVLRGAEIPTTTRITNAEMVLKKRLRDVLDLDITDVTGESIDAGVDIEGGNNILKLATESDAFIIIVNAPANEQQLHISSFQLAQCLNFVGHGIGKRTGIPVSLVLNKIDILPQAQGLKAKIEKKKSELSENRPSEEIINTLEDDLGAAISPLIKESISTTAIVNIIDQFCNHIGTTTPNRVFMCTSSGFDSINANDNTPQQLMPFGTGAAFLWTVYARLMHQQPQAGVAGVRQPDNLVEELIDDIRKLYTSGKGYFTKYENGERDRHKIFWGYRHISSLEHSQFWNKLL